MSGFQCPLGYLWFLSSPIQNLDILEPTRAESCKPSKLVEFVASMLDFEIKVRNICL